RAAVGRRPRPGGVVADAADLAGGRVPAGLPGPLAVLVVVEVNVLAFQAEGDVKGVYLEPAEARRTPAGRVLVPGEDRQVGRLRQPVTTLALPVPLGPAAETQRPQFALPDPHLQSLPGSGRTSFPPPRPPPPAR